MFTGIIRELGEVKSLEEAQGVLRLSVWAPDTAGKVEVMESVAVQGVCLSVTRKEGALLQFEMIPETQRLTNLGAIRSGDRVHLEPSLSLSDRLNGHFVFGHVDGLAKVARREEITGELILELAMPENLMRYMVPKGSVAVDGVSLTVGETVTESTLTIHLIPETLKRTTLGSRQVGDALNIETDYLAKVVEKLGRTQ